MKNNSTIKYHFHIPDEPKSKILIMLNMGKYGREIKYSQKQTASQSIFLYNRNLREGNLGNVGQCINQNLKHTSPLLQQSFF